ncbi:replicative DNA helicase [Bradyrhizobium japonicum]|uniref:DNA 5'-3' helicase n=1 Tax=Bradyrhizobium japonicum TaxID=375 RepID=A0ABV2RVU6_BRAJP|nr:DnaB-like helicase C-terminal domain-containing protein [Bradyrhizobium japonicum]WLB16193.1 DnaB-like helicase C-terminal domain-containing protein [Bradyrhizobium japonicum]
MTTQETTPRALRNIRAEEAIIGKIIGSADAYWQVSDYLSVEHFVVPHHRAIFAAVRDCCETAGGPSLSLLESKLPQEFDGQGSVEAVLQILIEKASDVSSALDFVDDVVLAWRERMGVELGRRASEQGKGYEDRRTAVEELFSKIDDADRARHPVRIGDAARGAMENSARAYEQQGHVAVGVTTKIPEIDKVIGPQIGGTAIVLAAPSGHGKSALLSQIMRNNAGPSLDTSSVFPSLLLSLEMSRVQVGYRDLASMTGVSVRKQITGDFNQKEFEDLVRARTALEKMPILIQDRSRMTTKQIERELRIAKRRYGIKQAGIDHMKLVQPEKEHWNLVRTIEYFTASMKDMAKELDLVIWQLAQITRAGQQAGGNWRFRDTDIYGGGLVIENSDLVLGVVIPKVWLRANKAEPAGEDNPKGRAEFDAWIKNMEVWKDKAEFAAFKVRSGSGETWTSLGFDGPRMTFGEVEHEDIPF